jgi:hypothetical protein
LVEEKMGEECTVGPDFALVRPLGESDMYFPEEADPLLT